MNLKSVLRGIGIVAAAVLLVTGIGLKSATAMGSDNPPPPSDDSSSKKKKKKQNSVIEEKFLHGYHVARFLILSGNYQDGIAAMHALGHDEHPDVANYIGYAYRKLGDYDDSKRWYEKALAADPNHVRTWSYFGMWQAEQGNRLKAEDYLQKVKLICGTTDCEEYRQLRAVIDGTASY